MVTEVGELSLDLEWAPTSRLMNTKVTPESLCGASAWTSERSPGWITISFPQGGRDGHLKGWKGKALLGCILRPGLRAGDSRTHFSSLRRSLTGEEGGTMPGLYLTMFHHVVEDGCPVATLMSRPPHQLVRVSLGGPG